jgi:hypothetical protein
MPRQRYDIGSKWLLHNQGKGALRVGGLKDVRRCEPMPGEIVQNRRLPDGLLQAFLGSDPKPHSVLIEIATYPERRALTQAMDDLTLAYSALGHLPEMLMLVLRPKGTFRIAGKHAIQSRLGLSRLEATWRTVELWTLSAEEFLAEGDVGILPWVPLMEMSDSPEAVLERCAARIDGEAEEKHRADLLAIAEVMTGLRFPASEFLTFFAGKQTMIESPVVQRWKAEAIHKVIIALLKNRFKTVPRDVSKQLREILDEEKLTALNVLAGQCPDLDAFREALLSLLNPG